MGVVTSASNWEVGIHKQTNEATVGTVADYAGPVFSGTPSAVRSTDVVNVTDAASIQGDAYYKPDEHWEADVVIPAWADALGIYLVSLWPTDTKTGAGPTYTHTFSGLGNQGPFVAMYSNALANLSETFEAGLGSSVGFSFDQEGGPLKLNYKAVGKKPTVAAYTKTVTNTLADGYFTAVGGTLKFEEDNATPVAHTNIQACTLTVDRGVTPGVTADATSVALLALGKVVPAITLSMYWEDFQAYRASYYGAVAGSAPSTTMVAGSVELNFVHSVQGTWTFKLTVPKVALFADKPAPDPAGNPAIVSVNGLILKPASGDHVAPVIVNAVATAY
jgi:hypothetical protein